MSLGLLTAYAGEGAAQARWTITGRVIDSASGEGLPNALVMIEGYGTTLSSTAGAFRLTQIPAASHGLRVEALGYDSFTTTVQVTRDTTVVVPLDVLPIELDGLDVELRTLDFDGRVRDPRTDSWVPDAEIRTDQGHEESSNLFGRFDLDDVYDGPPLRMVIRGFGYLPLDTTFIPDDAQRYSFALAPDPVMTAMIQRYVGRLSDRAEERIYEHQPALDLKDLAHFAPNTSLRRLMEAKYPLHVLRRIGCFIIDEREYRFGSLEERINVLEGTFANDLARLELLEFPGEARMFMVRVYTRRYFQRQVGTGKQLDPLSMTAYPGGFFCR